MMHFPQSLVGRTLITAAVLYALCLAILFDSPFPWSARGEIPRWLGIILISLTGPAMLLLVGANSWPLFVTASLSIALCLWFARVCWRRYPESEMFGFGLIGAAVIWIVSGWLAVAAAL